MSEALPLFTGLPSPAPCPSCGSWTGVMGKPERCPSCLVAGRFEKNATNPYSSTFSFSRSTRQSWRL